MPFNPKPLDDLENFLIEVKKSIPVWIKEVILQNEDVILDLQLQSQFYRGIDSEGNKMLPWPYALSTQKKKIRKGQPIDRITLKDTGRFYESVKVEVRNDEFEIKTSISYAVYIVKRYGAIFGITPTHIKDFTENYVIPYIKDKINDKLTNS